MPDHMHRQTFTHMPIRMSTHIYTAMLVRICEGSSEGVAHTHVYTSVYTHAYATVDAHEYAGTSMNRLVRRHVYAYRQHKCLRIRPCPHVYTATLQKACLHTCGCTWSVHMSETCLQTCFYASALQKAHMCTCMRMPACLAHMAVHELSRRRWHLSPFCLFC